MLTENTLGVWFYDAVCECVGVWNERPEDNAIKLKILYLKAALLQLI